MRISAVIPTYNRRERLFKVLGALEKQTVSPDTFEAVVVDDGSTDGTAEALEARRFPYALRVVRQSNGGPARARNAGIEIARGELILFLDDDVVPTPVLVEEHLRSHDAEENVAVMGPLASLDHYEQPWVAWEQEQLEKQYAAMQRGDWEPSYRQFWTGNASVARRHLVEAGLFNPDFRRGEDIELGLRLDARGVRFRFNPRARGLHHAERSLESWENAHRSYGALEVKMLSRLEDERSLLYLVGGNWSRLHPALRVITELCEGDPARFDRVAGLIRSYVTLSWAGRNRTVTKKALSVLANLPYWQASLAELGSEGARRVKRHGDAMRRGEL